MLNYEYCLSQLDEETQQLIRESQQAIADMAHKAYEARLKWLEAEISKSIVTEGLQDLPPQVAVSELISRGYQRREYSFNSKTTWGRMVVGEFIPIAEFDINYLSTAAKIKSIHRGVESEVNSIHQE